MAKTPEGLPVLEKSTLEAYWAQVRTEKISTEDYAEELERFEKEQPHLASYIKAIAQIPPFTPTQIELFGSQLYTLLRRQAEIDKLNEAYNSK